MTKYIEENIMERNTMVDDKDVISFPGGIPGFENSHRFVILSSEEYQPFHWLQCIDGEDIRFAIINPLVVKPDYEPKMGKAELESLRLSHPDDLLLYVIVTLKTPLKESTANFLGPLFVNVKERVGKQIIIDDKRYSLRERIIS